MPSAASSPNSLPPSSFLTLETSSPSSPSPPQVTLKPPDHQVAGHVASSTQLGPLIDSSGLFYKPLQSLHRGSTELSFYSSLSHKIPSHILPFFPTFHGTLLLPPSNTPHLILTDLLFNLPLPSIIDLKIGSRTWSPSFPLPYIQKSLSKDTATTSALLGFRISGLQIHADHAVHRPARDAVRRFGLADVRRALRLFVSSDPDRDPDCRFAEAVYGGADGVLAQLRVLKGWFEEQTGFHFYSTSVLIAYEKGGAGGVRVKLIDFAHVVEGEGVIDHNFLGGICSLIKFISDIVGECVERRRSGDGDGVIQV